MLPSARLRAAERPDSRATGSPRALRRVRIRYIMSTNGLAGGTRFRLGGPSRRLRAGGCSMKNQKRFWGVVLMVLGCSAGSTNDSDAVDQALNSASAALATGVGAGGHGAGGAP